MLLLRETYTGAPGGNAIPGLLARRARFRLDRPPAFVLGGIPLMRALALARIPVVLGTHRDDPALWSRLPSGRCLLPSPAAAPDDAIEMLLRAGGALAARVGQAVPLVYGSDDWLPLIYRHRTLLEPHFLFLAPDTALGEALLDKERFQALALERRLPVPRGFAWDESAESALCRHRGPLIVKPKSKRDWKESPVFHELLRERGKGLVYSGPEALLGDERLRPLRDAVTIQEYVPGCDGRLYSFHGFADPRGRLLAWFVGRKIRTYPSVTGESTFIEMAHLDRAAALGRALVRALGLTGVFKMDFKQDERDGRLWLLEVNARFNLWHHLGAVNGVNLPEIAYRWLVEGAEPRPRPRYGTRYRWLHLALDYKTYRERRAARVTSFARWLASIALARKVHAVFHWSDPGPMLKYCLSLAHRRIARWLFTAS
jgi:D-aspartate ligase